MKLKWAAKPYVCSVATDGDNHKTLINVLWPETVILKFYFNQQVNHKRIYSNTTISSLQGCVYNSHVNIPFGEKVVCSIST